MKHALAFVIIVSLAGCACAPDKGDAKAQSDTMGYISGCWAHAKGQDR